MLCDEEVCQFDTVLLEGATVVNLRSPETGPGSLGPPPTSSWKMDGTQVDQEFKLRGQARGQDPDLYRPGRPTARLRAPPSSSEHSTSSSVPPSCTFMQTPHKYL